MAKPIDLQRRVCRHPLPHGLKRNGEQLRRKPGPRLFGFRKQNLHALAPRVGGVVALVLVVGESRVIPELVGKLSEVVVQRKCLQEAIAALRDGAFQLA
jgi:hypothetical protein